MQPLQICIGPIIRIGRESWCLQYAGFFFNPSLTLHKASKHYNRMNITKITTNNDGGRVIEETLGSSLKV